MNFLFKPSYYLLIALSFITLNCSSDSDDGDVETNSSPKETAVIINNETGTKETGNTPNIPVIPVVVTDAPTDSDNNDNNTGNNTDNTTENNNTTPVVRVLTQQESAQLNFATFTIFNKSSSSPRTNARKWTMSINLFLSGAFSDKEINFINEFSSELASISSNIVLDIVPSKEQSNVEVYFATQEDFRRDRPDFIAGYRPSSPTVRGRANTSFSKSTNIINKGLVWIDPSAKNLQSIIKHELIHLLGFGHTNEANSIMKPTPEVNPTLSSNDVFAIHTLYNDMVKANFTESEVRNTVENNIETFFD